MLPPTLGTLTSGLCRGSADAGRLGDSCRFPPVAFSHSLACTHCLQSLEDSLRGHVHLQQIHYDPKQEGQCENREINVNFIVVMTITSGTISIHPRGKSTVLIPTHSPLSHSVCHSGSFFTTILHVDNRIWGHYTNLKTSWSTVMPAACVSSNSSISSALSTFFFLMAYFCTFDVTTSAGESGAVGAVCCGGCDITDGYLRVLFILISEKK